MRYYSTADKARLNAYSLEDAAFMGLAPDGGLFMPEFFPQADIEKVRTLAAISFADMAAYLAGLLFGEDVDSDSLEAIVKDAFNFEVPLTPIAGDLNTLQLFHGPTFAFKDFGGRFMGRMLGLLNRGGKPITVLTATSGDTGSAVAQGFWKVPGVKVIVLYPDGKVSDFQEAQMTTLGENIFPVRVNGCFDDCQKLVKDMFNDRELRAKARITSANSINVLRWLPQSFYYFYAWCQWSENHSEAPDIVVPSGNYGNITAGMVAQKMGMPVHRFIAGANANDVVPKFLVNGVYTPRPSVQTVANAMDVGAPSNFERLMDMYGDTVRSNLEGYSYSDEQIRSGIAELYNKYGYISDPHSAVGYLAFRDSSARGFWLSTAHPAKFRQVIRESIGAEPSFDQVFSDILSRPRKSVPMEVSDKALADYIMSI